MPLYEYGCRSCGARFERVRKQSERHAPTGCPECGAAETTLALSMPGLVGTGVAAAPGADRCATDPGGCCGGVCQVD